MGNVPVPTPATRQAATKLTSPASVKPPVPDNSVANAMAEADSLRAMTRSGGVRLIKRLPENPIAKTEPAKIEPSPESIQPVTPPTTSLVRESQPSSTPDEAFSFVPPPPIEEPPVFPTLRRKAKLTDLARIIEPSTPEPEAAVPKFTPLDPPPAPLDPPPPSAQPPFQSPQLLAPCCR